MRESATCRRGPALAVIAQEAVCAGGWALARSTTPVDPAGLALERIVLLPRLVTALVLGLTLASPALAHPHVWVKARAELVFDAAGKVSAIRHAWTFDTAYSAFVTQGLDKNGDGKLSPDELQELANTNAANLAEYAYFTVLKANGAKQAFEPPREPHMAFQEEALTLSFTLPLKNPAANRVVTLEVYDPSYFVDFNLPEGQDVATLKDAPKGCAVSVARPKPMQATQQQNLSENFFQTLTAAQNFGADYAGRILVACP
jgi:ABC-type uncharacterized transport system substrate-binding protein